MKKQHFFLAALFVFSASSQALVIVDNFNDNSLNPALWTNNSSGTSSLNEVNGQLEMTQGSSGAANVTLNLAAIQGDFTAEVDYSLLNWPANNGERLGIIGSYGALERISDAGFGGEVYLTHFSGVGDGIAGITGTTHTSGKLQLSRTGSSLSGAFWNGAGWTVIRTLPAAGTADITGLALQIWPGTVTPGVTAAFDNFLLNAPSMASAVPLPASVWLLAGSLLGLFAWHRNRV